MSKPAAGLAALAVAAALVNVAPASAARASDESAGRNQLPMWEGTWRREADVPISPRVGASVAVAPGARHGVVIWGGVDEDGHALADGIEIDTSDPSRSRAIPSWPLGARRDYGWADHDGRIYVWGGVDETGIDLADGAEFRTGWTAMPPAPLPAGPASMTVVEDTLWIVATDPGTGGAVLSSIRVPLAPNRGWSSSEPVPVPTGERYAVLGCCDEEANQVLVVSLQDQGRASAAVLDLVSGRWTDFDWGPAPALPAVGPVSGNALEDDLAVWVGHVPAQGAEAAGSAATIVSLRHPDEPIVITNAVQDAAAEPGGGPLVLGPSHVILVDAMQAYDLVRGRWLRLPSVETPGWSGSMSEGTAWWDRGKLWILGAPSMRGDPESVLWSFTPKPPQGSLALPPGRRRGSEPVPCVLFGEQGTWRLRGDPRNPRLVWLQRADRRAYLDWPDGWHVRFRPKLVITDTAGKVRYRGGQTCPAVTGTGG